MQLPKVKSKKETDLSKYTYLIYGDPKVGKTTFCSSFDGALFICTEPGHKFQEIFKLSPMHWGDIRDIAQHLIQDKHDYKNVIFDTADNAYKMCEQYVCKRENITHMSDLEFGKGYAFVKEEFNKIVSALTQKGFGVVFISHSQTVDVELDNVKRSVIDSTLSGSARKVIRGLCDFIFYCYTDSSGERFMRTKGTQSIVAGDRTGSLPEVMPLDFKTLKDALSE